MTQGKRTDLISEDIDWEEPTLKRWLGPMTRASTRYVYKSAFRTFTQFTRLTAAQLIDEAIEDFKKDPRERKDVVLNRLVGFYKYLKTDYPRHGRGNYIHKVVGKGVTENSAQMRMNVIRSFYATYDITIRLTKRCKLPKAKVENKRIIIKPDEVWKVKMLVDHARTPRDRAVLLFLFQGGLDVSTLCDLNYGDVAEGLARNDYPLKIEPQRVKTGVEFYTFIGKDGIEALKAYLADMKSRGVNFNNKMSLFLQERGKARLRTNNVQDMMKELAIRTGFVDGENNGNDFNPLGPHALRESFGSIMSNSGVPDTMVDFWLGHEIGDMARAYKSVQFEELKRTYLKHEPLISIAPKADVEKIRTNLKTELAAESEKVQSLVNSLATENIQLRDRVEKTEKEFVRFRADLKPFIDNVDYWEDFLEYVHEREKVEASEAEEKDKAKITKQLEKEGYFKKADEQIKKPKKQEK
jgi:site-specific recombinase XerD